MSSEPGIPVDRLLVVDANILVRAILGLQVLSILRKYADRVRFISPDQAFSEARTHIPRILERRKVPATSATLPLEILDLLTVYVTPISHDAYAQHESDARRRLRRRDEEDWPLLALALKLNCPIWTEDRDFFGSGVATWTTDRVEIYLGS